MREERWISKPVCRSGPADRRAKGRGTVRSVRWANGQIGQGAVFGFAAFAVAFAQQDGGGRAAIGDGCHIHARRESDRFASCQGCFVGLHDCPIAQSRVISIS